MWPFRRSKKVFYTGHRVTRIILFDLVFGRVILYNIDHTCVLFWHVSYCTTFMIHMPYFYTNHTVQFHTCSAWQGSSCTNFYCTRVHIDKCHNVQFWLHRSDNRGVMFWHFSVCKTLHVHVSMFYQVLYSTIVHLFGVHTCRYTFRFTVLVLCKCLIVHVSTLTCGSRWNVFHVFRLTRVVRCKLWLYMCPRSHVTCCTTRYLISVHIVQ